MDPLTLIALAAAAGFVFDKFSSQKSENNETNHQGLIYKKDIVTKAKRYEEADFDISSIDILPEYELVRELVINKFPITFITGGAGTGKSTFVRWLQCEFRGSILLGAPTAIAAINIGGKTLHSLCQLPPAWIIPSDIKYTPRRREVKEAKLLVIDEISMVTANVLDGVSEFLKLNRGIDKPFGGLPIIMIGDMFQLPPVVNNSVKDNFERIYGSAKFYNAKCITESTYYAVELKKTYRQSDQVLVDLLSKIREGRDLKDTLYSFNSQCTITNTPPNGAVWLSPRNAEVDTRNLKKLNEILSELQIYKGVLSGRFKSNGLPSPLELTLKKGAQVMFTKNDTNKHWINGTIGIVEKMDIGNIVVRLSESDKLVDVGKSTWTDYQYKWNDTNNRIDREEAGSYVQFPLTLAWAITIHKSQGRTIDRVHLDLGGGAFETGQTYVALSRCRSFKGLSLVRPVTEKDILVDYESKDFYNKLRSKIEKLPPEVLMKKLNN
ncbi:MAG: AAA family ATPase [Candidatus Thioglobus sp.]|jgi:ATP-dependent exoDNAse (exonuclease V) alpha subunit|nr:AAA family ATPase [Candidatus Thioglobus sp.]